MDLASLKIDREPRKRSDRRFPVVKWLVILAVLAGLGYALRVPLRRLFERVALPEVSVARASKTNPLTASAVSGTAANGYVVASRRAALSADISGRIVSMDVSEGSIVKKGQVVARLFAEDYAAAVASAEARQIAIHSSVARARSQVVEQRAILGTLRANVQAAKARIDAARARVNDATERLNLAVIEYNRAKVLVDQETETIAVLDTANSERLRAKASLRAGNAQLATEDANAQFAAAAVTRGEAAVEVALRAVAEARAQVAIGAADVDQARALLSKTEVRAPFDGIVVLKDAEVGEVVSPNSQGAGSRGSVVTMVDRRSLEVQIDLPETTLEQVSTGDTAAIYLDAYPTHRYEGRVARIWPTANRQKGTVELRVTFNAPDDRIRPEMGARIVFSPPARPEGASDEEAARSVVVVADAAVVRIDGRPHVFVLERDRLRLQPVSIGKARGGRVTVASGLRGDERVVLDPANDLEDGMRVRVKETP